MGNCAYSQENYIHIKHDFFPTARVYKDIYLLFFLWRVDKSIELQ